MATLLVSSTGGHLSELYQLAPRMVELERPFEWVTFRTPQSEALLADESVTWAHYTGQRDAGGVVRNLPLARRMLAGPEIGAVVSTGAAIALAFLPLARLKRRDAHYVEGIARTEAPSLTGRLLRAVPGVHFYTQWPNWADEQWSYNGSVFDRFTAEHQVADPVDIRNVVVLLGTMPYSFRRLVDRLLEILPPAASVTWQTGSTVVDDLPIEGQKIMAPAQLAMAIEKADVVVGHAGGGSALQVMEAGKCPVLVPRESAHKEHVDDHQLEIAAMLPALGLAVGARVEELTLDHLVQAAGTRVRDNGQTPDFRLS
jgi:UDP-N-acetylglucosamine transferase subunit ALG13